MKKLFVVFSIVLLLLVAPLVSQAQFVQNKTLEAIAKAAQVTEGEQLFWAAWNVIQEIYLYPIPFGQGEVDSMAAELREALKDTLAPQDSLTWTAIEQLIKSLDDKYSWFLRPKEAEEFLKPVEKLEKYYGIGIMLKEKMKKLVITFVLPDGPSQEVGLKRGDIIIAIDGKEIDGMDLEETVKLIKGKEGTTVDLTINRQNKILIFQLIRRKLKQKRVYAEIIDNVAYVKVIEFRQGISLEFGEVINELILKKNCQGIILDLRDNLGGLLSEAGIMSRYWIKGLIVTLLYKDEELKVETRFSQQILTKVFTKPTVILINQKSASASEVLSAALHDHQAAILVGEKSFGKGCGQNAVGLKDNSALVLISFLWKTPLGICINEVGLEPDFKVGFTDEELISGKDPQIEKALQIIKNKIGAIDLTPKKMPGSD